MLVSSEQGDKYIICPPQTPLLSRLPHNTEESSMCYTVRPVGLVKILVELNNQLTLFKHCICCSMPCSHLNHFAWTRSEYVNVLTNSMINLGCFPLREGICFLTFEPFFEVQIQGCVIEIQEGIRLERRRRWQRKLVGIRVHASRWNLIITYSNHRPITGSEEPTAHERWVEIAWGDAYEISFVSCKAYYIVL